MRCAKLRRIIVVIAPEDRDDRLQEAIEQHLARCPACAQFAWQMDSLARHLHSLPRHQAPEGFAPTVKRLMQVQQPKPRIGLIERIFGAHRAPAPVISPQVAWGAVSVAAVALAVGLLVGVPGGKSGPLAPGPIIASHSTATEASLPVMEEIMLRHRQYSRSFALTDDPGLNLISYSFEEE